MEPLSKLFLEEHGKYIFGPGRAELLRAVGVLGSLHKAAQQQGMSYRWAWGRIRETERALGVKLLMPDKEPGRGNTKVLTPEAHELLEWYSALEGEMRGLAEQAWTRMPGWLAPKAGTGAARG